MQSIDYCEFMQALSHDSTPKGESGCSDLQSKNKEEAKLRLYFAYADTRMFSTSKGENRLCGLQSENKGDAKHRLL
jgi:hypothetical protein